MSGRGKSVTVVCAWCRAIEIPGGWTKPDGQIGAIRVTPTGPAGGISHGICPTCLLEMQRVGMTSEVHR